MSYNKLKEKYRDTIVLVQNETTYEAYDNDALKLSKILDIELDEPDWGHQAKISLLPGAVKYFYSSIIRAGEKVILIERPQQKESNQVPVSTTHHSESIQNRSNLQKFTHIINQVASNQPVSSMEINSLAGIGSMKFLLRDWKNPQGWSKADMRYWPQMSGFITAVNNFSTSKNINNEVIINEIRDSVQTSFYTPVPVADAIVRSVQKLTTYGTTPVARILDPSAGTGRFIGSLHHLFPTASIEAIEKNVLSAAILKAYCMQQENTKGYNNVYERLSYTNKYNLIVSNIPFSAEKVFDEKAPMHVDLYSGSLHGFYFAKSIELLVPEGVMCFIAPTGIMESGKFKGLREQIVQQADFIGAIRLPDSVFSGDNTAVTSDIILLRKPLQIKKNLTKADKLFIADPTSDIFNPVPQNPFFTTHPDCVLGIVERGNQYSAEDGLSVKSTASIKEVADQVQHIFEKQIGTYAKEQSLSTHEQTKSQKVAQSLPVIHPETMVLSPLVQEGNIFKYNNHFYLAGGVVEGEEHFIQHIDLLKTNTHLGIHAQPMLEHVVNLRETMQLLLDRKESDLSYHQHQLNITYDALIALSSTESLAGLLQNIHFPDKDINLLKSLEIQTDKGVKKADIFYPEFLQQQVIELSDIPQAMAYSMNIHGYLDLDIMARQLHLDRHLLIEKGLQEQHFRFDPTDEHFFVMPNHFRSGQIDHKITALKDLSPEDRLKHGLSDAIIAQHVYELEQIHPAFVPIENIHPQLGEPAFHADIYKAFFVNYIGIKEDNLQILRNENNLYVVGCDPLITAVINEKLSIPTRGHNRCTGLDTMQYILQNEQKFFTYTVKEGERNVTYPDHAANVRFAALKEAIFHAWKDYYQTVSHVKEHIEKVYNRQNAYLTKVADGSYMDKSDYEKIGIKLYESQLNGAAKIIEENGGLLDHPTGSGKTITMLLSAMTMKRTGAVKKPMIIGLKANIDEIYQTAKEIYPEAKILYAKPSDFAPANRQQFFAKIAMNDWDLVLMSHSQFTKIPLHKETHIKILKQEADNISSNIAFLHNVEKTSLHTRLSKKQIAGMQIRVKNKTAEIARLRKNTDDINFDIIKLGVDHIMIDEAHLFKNLAFSTIHSGVAGISPDGSERAGKMYTHVQAIRDAYYGGKDKGLTFATATPVMNSMSELYTILRFVNPSRLRMEGLENFDAWIQTYGKISAELEPTVSGSYAYRRRCREFIKMDRLMKAYRERTHVLSNLEVIKSIKKPTANIHHINIPRTAEQEQYLYDIIDFVSTGDRFLIQTDPEKGDADGAEMLLASTHSNMASIDMRLIDKNIYADYCEANDNTKINILCQQIAKIYQQTMTESGAQAVFSNVGVPSDAAKNKGNFMVYDAIKQTLINKYHIPEMEIQFIHDFETDTQRDKLKQRVNAGEVRVILGSTEKLGTGNNIQERLKAVHNLDIPWRPADFEQRNGRAVRPGNMYDNVDIFFYTTEKTLDAFKFGILKNKQAFISQIRQEHFVGNQIKEMYASDADISYTEMMANITGNSNIKELAQLQRNYEVKQAVYDSACRQRWSLEYAIKKAEEESRNYTRWTQLYQTAAALYAKQKDVLTQQPVYTLPDGRKMDVKEFGKHVIRIATMVTTTQHQTQDVHLADFGHYFSAYLNVQSDGSTPIIKVCVKDKNQNEVITLKYNNGKIAGTPEIVGENPLKALDNIQKGVELCELRLQEYQNNLARDQENIKKCSQQQTDLFRDEILQISARLEELKRLVAQEKIMPDEENRIKFIQMVATDVTFREQTNKNMLFLPPVEKLTDTKRTGFKK